jgi:hypothetical protein
MVIEKLSSKSMRRVSIKEVDGIMIEYQGMYAIGIDVLLSNYDLKEIYKVIYEDIESQCSELLCSNKAKYIAVFKPKYNVMQRYYVMLCLKHYNEFKKILKLEE